MWTKFARVQHTEHVELALLKLIRDALSEVKLYTARNTGDTVLIDDVIEG